MIKVIYNPVVEITKTLFFEVTPTIEEDEFIHLAVTNPNGFFKTKVNKIAFRTFVQAVQSWDGKNQVVQLGPNNESYRMTHDRVLSGANKKKHLSIQVANHHVMLFCPSKQVYQILVDYLVATCGKLNP